MSPPAAAPLRVFVIYRSWPPSAPRRLVPTWRLQAGLLGLFATAYYYPSFVARRAPA